MSDIEKSAKEISRLSRISLILLLMGCLCFVIVMVHHIATGGPWYAYALLIVFFLGVYFFIESQTKKYTKPKPE